MKLLRSSLYTIPHNEAPTWGEGVPCFGWVRVTNPNRPLPPDETSPVARDVIHCAPGTEPPQNVVMVVVRGHVTPWSPEVVAQAWPNGFKYVLEARWMGDPPPGFPSSGPIPVQGKIIDAPENVELIETNIVPHEWAGDGAFANFD